TASETVAVSKVRTHGRSARALLRDALKFRVRRVRAGCVTTLMVHPPLNYAQAMTSGLLQGGDAAGPGRLRRALAGGLSLLGVARDLAAVPALAFAVLFHTRGRFELCIAQGPWEAA